jgi:hypothetical protein
MGIKLINVMKYFFILFLAIVSCKEHKKNENTKTTVEQEIVEPNVPFYELFLKYETKQKLFNKFPLDSSKYFKTYVLQGESKLISREFEDIIPSDILNKTELSKLNYHTVFEGYQWGFTIDRSKFFNTDFIDMYNFNTKKHKTNKTEIVYFFTYPLSVSKNKVLIGFKIDHVFHPKKTSKRVYVGFVIFEKMDNNWRLTGQNSL